MVICVVNVDCTKCDAVSDSIRRRFMQEVVSSRELIRVFSDDSDLIIVTADKTVMRLDIVLVSAVPM